MFLFSQAAWAGISQEIRSDLHHRKSSSFDSLLSAWELKYGATAVDSLVALAHDLTQSDADRYISILAAAKLGGGGAASKLAAFTKDASWMVRIAALRALTILHQPHTESSIVGMIHDPALVVRAEAVDAIGKLKPDGAAEALLFAIHDPKNYHGGKAQGIPQRALQALADQAPSPSVAPKLASLLDHEQDPALQKKTIAVLSKITGRSFGTASDPLAIQIKRWKVALAERK